MKDRLITKAAGQYGKPKSINKAASEPDSTQIYDIASDNDEEMADHAKGEAAKIQAVKY